MMTDEVTGLRVEVLEHMRGQTRISASCLVMLVGGQDVVQRVTLRSHSVKWMRSGGIIADDVDYDPTMSPNQENLIVTNIFIFIL
jgi:hypothetical protein